MIEVLCITDNDGHWYVIPKELNDEWDRLTEKLNSDDYPHRYDDEEEFEEKFGQYRTGGDLNLIQLYAKI